MDGISVSDFDFEQNRLGDLASQQANKLDHQLHVQFYKHAELNSFRSRPVDDVRLDEKGKELPKGEGRKIFDEFVYVRILMPANTRNVIERRATEDDKQRFSRQYQAFLANEEQLQSGTQLAELSTITTGQVAELRHLKVTTVEQLAGLPDSTVQLLGVGGMELKLRAQRFLSERQDNRHLVGENADLKARIEALEKLVQERAVSVETQTAVKVNAEAVK